MNKESIIKEIKNWFQINRPEIHEEKQTITEISNSIYLEIKNEIVNLEREPLIVILREFLRINYSSIVFQTIDELVSHEPYSKIFDPYRNIGFLFNSEVSAIMEIVASKKILEKYPQNIINEQENEEFRKEIKGVLNQYMKQQEGN